MQLSRVLGIIIFVVGIILLILGISGMDDTGQKIAKEATGHYTKTIMGYIIGGVALIIGGLALAACRRCSK